MIVLGDLGAFWAIFVHLMREIRAHFARYGFNGQNVRNVFISLHSKSSVTYLYDETIEITVILLISSFWNVHE